MVSKKRPPQPDPDVRKQASIKVKIGRDASTGQFISVREAQRRPNSTVVETIKRTPIKGKKK